MNETYQYPDVKNVVICGDIHGDFHTLAYKLCVQYGLEDTLVIVAGDCGFGFERPAYYEQAYNKDAGRLRKVNNYIAFVRGNHDNPSYFNEQRIAYKRWRTIPDYSIISACGHNILCVGGATSIDRTVRIKEQNKLNLLTTGYYWPDEAPVFSKETLDSLPIKFDTVVTHTSPSFCGKHEHSFLKEWAQKDETLIRDVTEERETMDKLFRYTQEKGIRIRNWIYGHFHESDTKYFNNIRFRMLDIMEFFDLT